ncbi:winged helix-turn-helix domain-containing protein [Deinococcus ficus]|nr:winged helix-turn-helix domain-containing protein [Deinococcus ficus]
MTPQVLLHGHFSPELRCVATVLGHLPVHLVVFDNLQTPPDPAALVIYAYRPGLEHSQIVQALTAAYPATPLVAIGPDYSEAIHRDLSRYPHVTYLSLNTPTAEKLNRFRTWLGLTGPHPLHVGPLTLNPDTGTVRCHERPLPLTATEFELLSVLMEHPGQRFTVSALEPMLSCKGVAVHVYQVRRKLAVLNMDGLLRGDASRGYTIDARTSVRRTPNPSTALRRHLLRL